MRVKATPSSTSTVSALASKAEVIRLKTLLPSSPSYFHAYSQILSHQLRQLSEPPPLLHSSNSRQNHRNSISLFSQSTAAQSIRLGHLRFLYVQCFEFQSSFSSYSLCALGRLSKSLCRFITSCVVLDTDCAWNSWSSWIRVSKHKVYDSPKCVDRRSLHYFNHSIVLVASPPPRAPPFHGREVKCGTTSAKIAKNQSPYSAVPHRPNSLGVHGLFEGLNQRLMLRCCCTQRLSPDAQLHLVAYIGNKQLVNHPAMRVWFAFSRN